MITSDIIIWEEEEDQTLKISVLTGASNTRSTILFIGDPVSTYTLAILQTKYTIILN